MTNTSLSAFVTRVIGNQRITFGDVRRLQRDILPDGIAGREEAEALLALDRVISRTNTAWADYLVSAITDFVVWGARPTGYVDQDTVQWLVAALAGEHPTNTALRLAREVTQEAQEADGTLVAVAAGSSKRRRATPSMTITAAEIAA